MMLAGAAEADLVGRHAEAAEVERLVREVRVRGGAVILRGEPGIGKSALLGHARRYAARQDVAVLETAGVESETQLAFSGLHQLVRPVLDREKVLLAPQREALRCAFGQSDAAVPDLSRISIAALSLLAEVASERPLLIVADDLQWLDRASASVLTFIARRTEADRIAVLGATRDGRQDPFDAAGLADLLLARLTDGDAARVLDRQDPALASGVRDRLLTEAAGNPLALIELPVALAHHTGALLPALLPLTERLQRAFTDRLHTLPHATRTVLLAAALSKRGDLGHLLAAATQVDGEVDLRDIDPAVHARLATITRRELRFRHPLVRSAVHHDATTSERYAMHRAFAATLDDASAEGIWHRSAATLTADPVLAAELERLAAADARRGALEASVAALERAVELTEAAADRGRRTLRAATLALHLGRRDIVRRLLEESDDLEVTAADVGRRIWIRATVDPPMPGDEAAVVALVDTAERMRQTGEGDLALDLLQGAAAVSFWADREGDIGAQIRVAAERIDVPDTDSRTIVTTAFAAPIGGGATVIDAVARSVARREDPAAAGRVASAAVTVGALAQAMPFLDAAVTGLRREGRLVQLSQTLNQRGWASLHLGRWDLTRSDAAESERLARETGQSIWEASALNLAAVLAGYRGDLPAAETQSLDAEQIARRLNAPAALSVIQFGRGLVALSAGDHAEAYAQLARMFDRADVAYHGMGRCWAIGHLAEAASRSGRAEAARGVMRELEPLAERTPSPFFHVSLRHARAVLADDAAAPACFAAALEADLTLWPVDWARIRLAHGAWLRRHSRAGESRAPLRAARDTFDALGAVSWGDRAREELRAAGEPSLARRAYPREELTPQEHQIAHMAAEGLSNREIGHRLFLSHRTVSSHLYRVFPKLGITSRAQIARALGSEDASAAAP